MKSHKASAACPEPPGFRESLRLGAEQKIKKPYFCTKYLQRFSSDWGVVLFAVTAR
jgi:hypothetical protein